MILSCVPIQQAAFCASPTSPRYPAEVRVTVPIYRLLVATAFWFGIVPSSSAHSVPTSLPRCLPPKQGLRPVGQPWLCRAEWCYSWPSAWQDSWPNRSLLRPGPTRPGADDVSGRRPPRPSSMATGPGDRARPRPAPDRQARRAAGRPHRPARVSATVAVWVGGQVERVARDILRATHAHVE